MLYVILLIIHKWLPKQRCSSHFIRPEKKKRKYCIHSPTPALTLTLTLSLTLTLNHLANEVLQTATMQYGLMGCTKFTTSGAHDIIAITSPQKNDLCTEELRDRAHEVAQTLDEVSLPLRRAIDSVVYFFGRERGLWS